MIDELKTDRHRALLADYFSDEAIENIMRHLPEDTFDELVQVLKLVEKRTARYNAQIKQLKERMHQL